MKYEISGLAFAVFAFFVGIVLALSFYLGRKAKSAKGYYAAHGQIHWFVNGIAFAGDYLSAASFLGICGMIAFFGYDGFLYSIGYLAGWVVALFVIAEPLKRMGRFTFADALDAKFNSRGIKLAAAISTLLVSIFYLIPQMVGAGVLVQPLLGYSHLVGVVIVGVVVILIVVTAGMVSTTWVQFIKGSLLVIFCLALVVMILNRGLSKQKPASAGTPADQVLGAVRQGDVPYAKLLNMVPSTGDWAKKNYRLFRNPATGEVVPWAIMPMPMTSTQFIGWEDLRIVRAQAVTVKSDGTKLVNGLPQGHKEKQADLFPVGTIAELPGGMESTGPLGPVEFLSTLQHSKVTTWANETIKEADGSTTTVYFQKVTSGDSLLQAGGTPTFKGIRSDNLADKLDFISLMIALFCGTASLPHILIRYYTVKDGNSARKSTVVGIASIGFFYVLTLFLGLGAMTSGGMDPTNNNMAAPLLAKTFGELPFAIVSAIAFTTVLGTVSGLIMAASGAVAHDLMTNVLQMPLDDHAKVRAGKITAVFVGVIAMVLGVVFEKLNVSFLVGWAFNVAASANLPSLVMLLFWKKTTKQGITVAIIVGLLASLAWILLSAQAYKDVYSIDPTKAIVPFSQPGLVTIPLGFVVLVVVSLLTQSKATDATRGFEVVGARSQ